MTEKMCKHFWVAGKVQGVWFRANTKKAADEIGMSGWVRNLPDGRVEVLACGTTEQIVQLEAWLKRGPTLARVDDLQSENLPWREFQGFNVM
jgi:acylphosphatase